jgi:uncharacterized membrane protein
MSIIIFSFLGFVSSITVIGAFAAGCVGAFLGSALSIVVLLTIYVYNMRKLDLEIHRED